MVVTTGQVQRALANGLFQTEVVKDGDLNSGQFDGTALGTDEQGVIGYIEPGNDAPLQDAQATIVGRYLGNDPTRPTQEGVASGSKFLAGQTGENRIQARIRDSNPNDAPASARFGIGGVKEFTIAQDNILPLEDENRYDPNNVSNFTDIPVQTARSMGTSVVTDGEYITWIFYPGSGGPFTASLSDSTFNLPLLKWDGRGL